MKTTNTNDTTGVDFNHYDYGQLDKVSWMSRLLWYSAGADSQLLMRCPVSDRVKYQGLGGVVLSVGFLAFFSGSYAFYTVFSPKEATVLAGNSIDLTTTLLSVFFGFCWALIIFNLDRFIVSSTGKGDGTDKITMTEFLNSLPRLAMAIIIGLCLSAPLEIKILESEIKAQLEIEQTEYLQELNALSEELVNEQRAELRDKLDTLYGRIGDSQNILEKRRLELNLQRKELELEAEGRSGSGIAGRGPAWQDKKDNLDRMQNDLDRDRASIENKNGSVDDEIKETKAQLEALNDQLAKQKESNVESSRHLDGLLKRIQISHEIGGLVPYAIMLLLLCIEAGPIFFKLMLSKGAYDYLEENQKRLARSSAGIESYVKVTNDDGSISYVDVYHNADSIIREEKVRLDSQQALNQAVRQRYNEKITEDINKNPDKYVEHNNS